MIYIFLFIFILMVKVSYNRYKKGEPLRRRRNMHIVRDDADNGEHNVNRKQN